MFETSVLTTPLKLVLVGRALEVVTQEALLCQEENNAKGYKWSVCVVVWDFSPPSIYSLFYQVV